MAIPLRLCVILDDFTIDDTPENKKRNKIVAFNVLSLWEKQKKTKKKLSVNLNGHKNFQTRLQIWNVRKHKSATMSETPRSLKCRLIVHSSSICFCSEPCCTTAPQSGSWATCSRISSTSRFFPGGSTSFVILCCSVRGNAMSCMNWPSGLLSTCRSPT